MEPSPMQCVSFIKPRSESKDESFHSNIYILLKRFFLNLYRPERVIHHGGTILDKGVNESERNDNLIFISIHRFDRFNSNNRTYYFVLIHKLRVKKWDTNINETKYYIKNQYTWCPVEYPHPVLNYCGSIRLKPSKVIINNIHILKLICIMLYKPWSIATCAQLLICRLIASSSGCCKYDLQMF